MPRLLQTVAGAQIFSAAQYPRSNPEAEALGLSGGRNKEMRALTIAAFRVAQNNTQLSTRAMNGEMLLHLLAGSTTALNYWVGKGRLIPVASDYALSPEGLAECQNTLLGLAGPYSTTEEKVQEWVSRALHGDQIATRQRTFASSAWPTQ